MVWVGLTPCRRETPNLSQFFFFNASAKMALREKKSFGAPPPPPAYQLFWELRDYGLAAVRKKTLCPPHDPLRISALDPHQRKKNVIYQFLWLACKKGDLFFFFYRKAGLFPGRSDLSKNVAPAYITKWWRRQLFSRVG